MAVKYSGTFAITGAPTITITSPNSGTFYVGDSVNITWSTTGTVGNVKIKLYNTANSLVDTIVSSTPNDGSYYWDVRGSQIAQHETEYQLKIEEASDGNPYDYSGNLEIYPYINMDQPQDALRIDQSVSTAPSTWKITRATDDEISLEQSLFSKVVDTWKFVRANSDGISVSQDFNKAVDTWRHVFAPADSLSISQSVLFDIEGNKSATDALSLTQSVSTATDTWRHVLTPTDDLEISQILNVTKTVWRYWRKISAGELGADVIGISQSVTAVKDIYFHKITDPVDGLGISQVFDSGTDIWKHIRDMSGDSIDDIGISQSVDIQATTHYDRDATDGLGISQGVTPATSIWKHIRQIVEGELDADGLGLSQSVDTVVEKWFHIITETTDVLGISQSVSPIQSRWFHIRSIIDGELGAEKLSIEQAITIQATHHYEREVSDDLNLTEAVGTATRIWRHVRDIIEGELDADDLSISQTVDPVKRVWRHQRTTADYLDLSDAVTIPEPIRWKYVNTVSDDIGISQSVIYATDIWANVASNADELSISDAPYYYVVKETGVMYFIYQGTVIDLGTANLIPVTKPTFPKQLTKVSGGGQAKVTDYSPAVQFIDVKVRVDQPTRTSLYNFFKNTVQFTRTVFTFKDGGGLDYNVRLWDANGFNLPISKGGQVDVGLRLRKELYS